ncbi:MAG: hypothetical protein ACYC91_13735 [Solirubrobacteraceae bacterium]
MRNFPGADRLQGTMRYPKRLLTTTLLLLAASAVLTAPAGASTFQEAIFQDDAQLHANLPGTLATMRSLGISRVRVALRWSTIAPQPRSFRAPRGFRGVDPDAYPRLSWDFYDQVLRQASADGISVDFMLTGPAPLWATGRGMPRTGPGGGPFGQWKPSAGDFRQFAQAAGSRYSGRYRPRGASAPLPRVGFWSIWNEPNYGIDLAPQTIDGDTVEVGAAEYRGLLDAAWNGLHASGHGRDTILIGETAPRGLDHPIGNFSGVKPLRFLRAMYCVDSRYRPLTGSAAALRGCPTSSSGSWRFRGRHPALFEASGYADHPYEQGVAPNKPTYACGRTTCTNRSGRSDPDYADLPMIGRLEGVLDRLQRIYGSSTRFPIYSTEYGYWTNPPDRVAVINQQTAAFYLNWAEYISWRQPRLRSYSQYLLVDPPRGNFASGLELPSGRHKVTYSAYELPLFLPVTSGRRGERLEVWGDLRPSHFAHVDTGRLQQVALQYRHGFRGAFQTVARTTIGNSRGYFDVHQAFPASGAVRLAWTSQTGQIVLSRTQTIVLR